MIVTIVAVLCQNLAGVPASQPVIVCHEEIVVQGEMDMSACFVSQPGIAEWKMQSRFRSQDWEVARIRCIPGIYMKRDAI